MSNLNIYILIYAAKSATSYPQKEDLGLNLLLEIWGPGALQSATLSAPSEKKKKKSSICLALTKNCILIAFELTLRRCKVELIVCCQLTTYSEKQEKSARPNKLMRWEA